MPILVIGYIDLIEKDGVPIDFKTSNKSWSYSKAKNEIQPIFYLAALIQEEYEISLNFRHYVFVKNKTPKVQIWETSRTIQEIFLRLQRDGIEEGTNRDNKSRYDRTKWYRLDAAALAKRLPEAAQQAAEQPVEAG